MTKGYDEDFGIVYSTEHGKMCAVCGKPVKKCVCSKKKSIPLNDGVVKVGRETSGRKGKGVTIITGVPLDHDGLLKLAKLFKQKCGCGGTVKNGVIEIQGDHRAVIVEALKILGYTVKRTGG
jgi:translation initiation factor 1